MKDKLQIDLDRMAIAEKWKELDAYYRAEISRLMNQFHIEKLDGGEGVDIWFFFRGRYAWAEIG